METAAERLQFAVLFSQLDLKVLRPGDWMNLRDDLLSFLVCKQGLRFPLHLTGGFIFTPLEHPLPQDYSENDFIELQVDVRKLFEVPGVVMPPIKIEGGPRAATGRPPIHGRFDIIESFGLHLPHFIGSTRACFLLMLQILLYSEREDRIFRCPECEKIFFRIKKQKYCSRTCVNRVAVRKWRQTAEGKTKESERMRQRYKNKIETSLGPNVKVRERKETKHGKTIRKR